MLPILTRTKAEKEDHPRRSIPKVNGREGEDNSENLDLFNNEEDGEIHPEMSIDEIKILRISYHAETKRRVD
jgi:hypothetical protein